jgi:uroporphyrinogen-III decarboxylase
MIDFKEYGLSDKELKRYEDLDKEYMMLAEDPDNCIPKFGMPVYPSFTPTWEEMMKNPETMLHAQLESLKMSRWIGDDIVMGVRAEFGTPTVANAFGCDLFYPVNNLPCCRNHILRTPKDVLNVKKPSINCETYSKVRAWTEAYKKMLPEGYHIMMSDIQGPFNNAHVIRGTDIFTDMYDDPEVFDRLMDVVTDATIEYAKAQREWIGAEDGWQYDWGAKWKGNARISNCSLHMIGKELYEKQVRKYDVRFLEQLGGGRMHYCGTPKGIVETLAVMPGMTGVDYDSLFLDMQELMEAVPKNIVLHQALSLTSLEGMKILESRKWPFKKRNVIFRLRGPLNRYEAKNIYRKLRSIAEA